MKMRTVEVTVGAFMVAGILSLLMLALQVSGLSDFFRDNSGYQVKAEFSNIGGLKPRAKISIAGVVVGRVVSIVLEPKSYNAEVIMALDPNKMEGKLPSDTRASIMTAGLLGDNYIALTPGFSETSLNEGSVIPLENTEPAIVLEQLISKFVANQVSPSSPSTSSTPNNPNNPTNTETPASTSSNTSNLSTEQNSQNTSKIEIPAPVQTPEQPAPQTSAEKEAPTVSMTPTSSTTVPDQTANSAE